MPECSSRGPLLTPSAALGVELDKLTDVGALYLKSKHPTDRLLGRNLLLCASRAGSLSATIFLVYSAHIQGALKAVQLVKPKTHLKSSVQAGATSVQALVLQGKLYLDQKLYKEAASCFEKAIAVARQCKDNDDTRLDKFLRWIGFDMGTNDPNLDKRRPQDLGLDHVEAHIQLAILRGNHKIGGDGIANLRIAALKYDDPMAYYMLACRDSIQFSYKWLQYMLKAAASGYRSAMEEVADLLGFEEEDLEKMVPDKRVRDWVLHNPVYWTASKHVESPSSPFYNSGDPKNQRILRRYDWALAWQKAAAARAQDINLAYFNIALIQWAKANKMQEMKLPLRLVRLWRVLSLGHTKALKKARKVEMELKKYSEIEFRLREQHPMYREAADLLDCRIRKSASIEWLFKFLESIDDVPAGTWRWDKNKPL